MSPTAGRPDGRSPDQLRPIRIQPGFQKHPAGSVMIQYGDTWVLCAASVEERQPPFLSGTKQGWVTAEYAMLPSSTHTRSGRRSGGRDKEIQRLIGRGLRAAVDMKKLGERSITIDCDVIQADGGTRTASVTGGWVALALAIKRLEAAGALAPGQVLGDPVAAVSVGVVHGEPRLDLPYSEDSIADVDMNVVMTEGGNLIEVQGTGEGSTFTKMELDSMLELAHKGVKELCVAQRAAIDAFVKESA